MGKKTGIAWTDSTWSSWWGCSHVSPACDHCWAEGVDKRVGGGHWGLNAPRRLLSEHARNEPYRWNRAADKFEAEHGRRRRVFTLSMGDLFDNEIPDDWRRDHMRVMTDCTRLEWQICTKRVSNIAKMIPPEWCIRFSGDDFRADAAVRKDLMWPRNIGVLITIVTQAEADRDVPRLLELKKRFGIPWVGISYEPAQEYVYFGPWLGEGYLDQIIFGGKSGPQWNDRPFDIEWAREVAKLCHYRGTAFFMKQVAAFRPTDAMIPEDLMIRQWPKGH